jgi:hypothetical protein
MEDTLHNMSSTSKDVTNHANNDNCAAPTPTMTQDVSSRYSRQLKDYEFGLDANNLSKQIMIKYQFVSPTQPVPKPSYKNLISRKAETSVEIGKNVFLSVNRPGQEESTPGPMTIAQR